MKNICKRQLDIFRATVFTTYKEWVAYRSHMAVSVFVGPVFSLYRYLSGMPYIQLGKLSQD